MLINILTGGGVTFAGVIVAILSSLAVIFLTMPIHEFAHAFAAEKLGDRTQRYAGRLTVNPFAHIDYVGALFIILFGFGWAKPVMVNSHYFKNPKRDMAITALAGPLSNLLLALICMFLYNGFMFIAFEAQLELLLYLSLFFYYIAVINTSLAIFNLVPVPPLDGSRLLQAFLPDRLYYKMMQYERYLSLAVMLLVVSGILSRPLSIASGNIINLFDYLTAMPFNSII